MKVDTQLLDEYIENSGLKVTFIIEKLGISHNAFYKKKNNEIPFKVAEIYVICDLLKITDEMVKRRIFCANEV